MTDGSGAAQTDEDGVEITKDWVQDVNGAHPVETAEENRLRHQYILVCQGCNVLAVLLICQTTTDINDRGRNRNPFYNFMVNQQPHKTPGKFTRTTRTARSSP